MSSSEDHAEAPARIDVHHHFTTPYFVEATRERFELETIGIPRDNPSMQGQSIQDSISAMDAEGVTTAMLSLRSPGPYAEDKEAARQLARHCNEFGARAVSDHAGRFGHFASLPLPDIEGSLREIEYSFDTLKAEGVIVHSSNDDVWLGDPRYWPIYEELNRRSAIVFVHPLAPGCCQKVPLVTPPAMLELAFDTARAITNLIYTGAAAKFRDIRFIFSHGGGAISLLLDRIEGIARIRPDLGQHLPNGASHALGKFYYDTAQIFNPAAFAALRAILPPEKILFGTDGPFATPGCVEKLIRLVPNAAERRAIEWDNAARLLPQLAAEYR